MIFFTNKKAEEITTNQFIKTLHIKTPSTKQHIRYLSGGNQQKVILARWLAEPKTKILIVDEPTRGIDVGAKSEIYEILQELASKGMTIIVVSSELPEVLGISDRVLVMCGGSIQGILSREEATESSVLSLALPDSQASQPQSQSQTH